MQTTTPAESPRSAPCPCAACVEEGNSIDDCEDFGIDCECMKTTPETTTEEGSTTIGSTTEEGSTTQGSTTVESTTPAESPKSVVCPGCASCVEEGNSIEDCEDFGLDCACESASTTPESSTERGMTPPTERAAPPPLPGGAWFIGLLLLVLAT